MSKKYYYRINGPEFLGFELIDPENTLSTTNVIGPFDTFQACQDDAIDYFIADRVAAEDSLRQIRASKEKDVEEKWEL